MVVDDAPLPTVAAALLGLGLALELILPVSSPELASSVTLTAAPTRQRSIAIPPVADRPEILRSPIFAPDRGAGGGGAGPQASDFTLLGTALSRTGGSAVVMPAGGSAVSISIGGRIGSWRLIGVGRTRARFAGETGVRDLVVGASSARAATPAPNVPPAGAAE